MNQLDLYKIKARPKVCLLLFAAGGLLCILLDLCGVPCLAAEPIIQKGFVFPLNSMLTVALIYAVGGIVIGLLTKNRISAVIYGIAFGQCQFWITIVYHFAFAHLTFDWYRIALAKAGVVCAAVFAALIPHRNNKI